MNCERIFLHKHFVSDKKFVVKIYSPGDFFEKKFSFLPCAKEKQSEHKATYSELPCLQISLHDAATIKYAQQPNTGRFRSRT